MFQYGREVQNPETARQLEYLIAAYHAYASSSVGGNTRKYHGLFVRDARVLLAGFDERVNGVQLSAQQYKGALNEVGLRYLAGFCAYPPSWLYWIDDIVVKKTITFDGSLAVTYDITGDAKLWVRPLITDRPVHAVTRNPNPDCVHNANGFRWAGLFFCGDIPYTADPVTYRNVWYQREYERGYEPVEDLYSPGVFQGSVRDDKVLFRCTGDVRAPLDPPRLRSPRIIPGWLDRAADTFCQGNEIVAGYPWFCESWGRDSAISVTGLLTGRGRRDEARAVLRCLSALMKDGVVPNRIPDNYHTSDASLWFIDALIRYQRSFGDDPFMEEMKPVIETILKEYPSSAVARLDHDLIAVVPGSTWMDTVFTPRAGKPVEINALWVQALAEAEALGIPVPVSSESAHRAFRQFWNEEKKCLYDVIDPIDPSVRPNQVIAIAFGLVSPEQAPAALDTVSRELLTPYGLRTLSPLDSGYTGRYTGDRSYHNGCVWPWLTGYYCEALLRSGVSHERAAQFLIPILAHAREAGIGYISEIFDGDPPFSPNGCIAQAWSVAEVARAYHMVSAETDATR
jgi:glycogen debranching enzyme